MSAAGQLPSPRRGTHWKRPSRGLQHSLAAHAGEQRAAPVVGSLVVQSPSHSTPLVALQPPVTGGSGGRTQPVGRPPSIVHTSGCASKPPPSSSGGPASI